MRREMRKNVPVGKYEGKKTFGRLRGRRKDNIDMGKKR
jgi:hypothetical protein